jgi:hypothetical protein
MGIYDFIYSCFLYVIWVQPSPEYGGGIYYDGRFQWPRGLRPFACWDCGFEYRRKHGCLCLVSVVCCQVEVSATGWSIVQRSPTECGVSECDHEASSVVCCQVEVSASGWSLVQRSPTECGVSECDHEALSVVCCQVEASASGWSLVQRSPTECGVSECDREVSIMRRPWTTRGCCGMGKLWWWWQ